MESAGPVDLVVIGAGWNGLCAAKTYHQCHPDAHLIILDDQPTIGGVWAEHRLYPGLKTNNMRGNYEFGDFTFVDAGMQVKEGEHILGPDVYEYLRRYAEAFGILKKIRFNTKAVTIQHLDDSSNGREARWSISTMDKTSGEKEVILAAKIVIATGLTSDAFVPRFTGEDVYGGQIVHVKDFEARSAELFKESKRVTILGGTKSAWDASYAFASAGIPVDWVIRKSGHGPVWMSPAYFSKGWNLLLERLVHMRLISIFSPCIWGPADGFGLIRKALHKTKIGRWITRSYWRTMQRKLECTNGYANNPEVLKLKPWVDIFWIAGSLSILNYKTDFFQLVKDGMIKVHIADIVSLQDHQINLSGGKTLSSDALVCSTGWRHRPSIQFLPEGIDVDLGLPHSTTSQYSGLVAKADSFLMNSFPALQNQPTLNPHYRPMNGTSPAEDLREPYRLYRFMVPPKFYDERSIAFAGVVQSISTVFIAQAQGVWMTAYFDGHDPAQLAGLQHDEEKKLSEIRWQTLLHTQYGKWRCPGGYGCRFPDFVYDGLPYIDLLLSDFGLKTKRKGNFLKELVVPYQTNDYRTLVDEWRVLSGTAQ
ncbi:hypothetical protein FDECE_13858 [Fusarium decemcellulare]|nr:hypothetical protein FDECE_13858 [Fusarium decemcellulare]